MTREYNKLEDEMIPAYRLAAAMYQRALKDTKSGDAIFNLDGLLFLVKENQVSELVHPQYLMRLVGKWYG